MWVSLSGHQPHVGTAVLMNMYQCSTLTCTQHEFTSWGVGGRSGSRDPADCKVSCRSQRRCDSHANPHRVRPGSADAEGQRGVTETTLITLSPPGGISSPPFISTNSANVDNTRRPSLVRSERWQTGESMNLSHSDLHIMFRVLPPRHRRPCCCKKTGIKGRPCS